MPTSEKPKTGLKSDGPDEQIELANMLKAYGVKPAEMCDTIAANIANVGGINVFQDADALAAGLTRWSENIAPFRRRNILLEWCKKKGIEMTESAESLAGAEKGKESAALRRADAAKKGGGVFRFTVKRDAEGVPQIEPCKTDDELGGTLEEAKAARNEMVKLDIGGDNPYIFDEESQRYVPNWRLKYVQEHMDWAKAICQHMNQAMGSDNPPDPWDIVIDQMQKRKQAEELLGGPASGGKPQSTIGELVGALKDMKEMMGGGENSAVLQKLADVERKLAEAREAGQNSAVEALRAEIQGLKDQGHQQELARRDQVIASQSTEIAAMRQDMTALGEQMKSGNRTPGKTAYDLLSDIAQKLPDRSDIRALALERLGNTPQLTTRTSAERSAELGGLVEDMEGAANIQEAAAWIFHLE